MSPLLLLAALAAAPAPQASADRQARTVQYSDKDIVSVRARVRFTTVVVLPEGERILEYVCGDREAWMVEGAENFAYIRPDREGAQTNVSLITASGHVYSLLLTEVGRGGGEPDLKLFIQAGEDSLRRSLQAPARFVPAAEAQQARQAAAAVAGEAERQQQAWRAQYPTSFRFEYAYDGPKHALRITAMYHDGRQTFLHVDAGEKPALYELVDGQPALVSFQLREGVYVVDKVLERGYLALGKVKLGFQRKAS